jgi:hypothetical protein
MQWRSRATAGVFNVAASPVLKEDAYINWCAAALTVPASLA